MTCKKYVILSVSEISHNQSEKYMPRQFLGGILPIVQNDVRGIRYYNGLFGVYSSFLLDFLSDG